MSHHGATPGQNAMNCYLYQVVAAQTVFTGLDVNRRPLGGLVAGRNMIIVDGVILVEGKDYTVSSDGGSVTLNFQADVGSMVSIIAYGIFSVANALSQSQSDAAYYRRRNRVINASHQISQFNSTNQITLVSATPAYLDDGHIVGFASSTAVVKAQLVASVTPSGAVNRLRVSVTTADASGAAGNYAYLKIPLEGSLNADLQFGQAAASARTIMLRMGLRMPQAGVYSVVVTNGSTANRFYTGTVTIAPGEVGIDVIKYVRLTPDLTGTWNTDTSQALSAWFFFHSGTTYQTATLNAWQTGTVLAASTNVAGLAAVQNFDFFDWALWDVSGMSTQSVPFFEAPVFDEEIRRCQRYYFKPDSQLLLGAYAGASNSATAMSSIVIPQMRVAPSVAFQSLIYSNCSALIANIVSDNSISFACTSVAVGGVASNFIPVCDARL